MRDIGRRGARFDLHAALLYRSVVVYHGDDDESDDDRFDEDDVGDEAPRPRPSEPPGFDDEGRRRRRLERILPEVLKRAIERGLESGIGTLTNSRDALQGVVGKVELPKEVASYVLSQVDETKSAMVRVVAREVREFLEAADLATELQRALTSLSFEVRTEIRFIPNDAGGVTPRVKAAVGPKRGARRPSAAASDDEDEG